MKLRPIHEQVVVITGATSGIGRASALRFAEKGARLVLAGRDEAALNSLVEEIKKMDGVATPVVADVSEFDQVQGIVDQAIMIYGKIDTWVQLAAVSVYAPFNSIAADEMKRVIDVNLLGQMYGAKAALPVLIEQGGGALIHISSIEAHQAMPLHSPYTASKFGVRGFVDALRMELEYANVPVSVTNVMPGSINTPFFDKALTRLGVKPRPMPPVYEPEIVAEVIVYAAEHPVREIYAGGGGKVVGLLHRISPRLGDRLLRRPAVVAQLTDQPKAASAPSNLFQHIEGYDTVRGSFSEEAKDGSLYTWLRTHPRARAGLAASTLLVGALAAGWALLSRQPISSRSPQASNRWLRPILQRLR